MSRYRNELSFILKGNIDFKINNITQKKESVEATFL